MRSVRPLAPEQTSEERSEWLAALEEGSVVQLQYIAGWWDVLVLERAGDEWRVKSMHFEAEHTVTAEMLRPKPQWYWDGGAKAWLIRGREEELEQSLEAARETAGTQKSAFKCGKCGGTKKGSASKCKQPCAGGRVASHSDEGAAKTEIGTEAMQTMEMDVASMQE